MQESKDTRMCVNQRTNFHELTSKRFVFVMNYSCAQASRCLLNRLAPVQAEVDVDVSNWAETLIGTGDGRIGLATNELGGEIERSSAYNIR